MLCAGGNLSPIASMENLRWWRLRWPWSLSGNRFRLPKIDPCDEFLESANLGIWPSRANARLAAGGESFDAERSSGETRKTTSGFLVAYGVQPDGAPDGEAD